MAVSPTQLFPNRVNSNGSNAVNGPTTGVDLGDATILTHTGTHYAYLSGAATGNFLSVPDDSTLDLTSDYEIVCWVGPTDWTPSGNMWLVRKGSAWAVQIRTDGKIRAIVNNNNYDSTIATGFTDGDAKWLKVTRDQSSGDIDIYTAADQATEPSSWDTLGTTIAGTTDATNTNTADVSIGAATTGAAEFGGCIYRAIVRDSIGAATDVLDVNLAADIDTTTDHDAGQTSFTCTTGQTVTVNRATSGLVTAIVTRPVALLDGSDDYIQLPADAPTPTFTATTGKYTIVYFGRWHVETGSTQRLFSTESSGNDGLHIHSNSAGVERPRITVGGATSAKGFNPPGAATLTERQAFVVAVVIDNGNAYAYLSGYGLSSAADITGVGTITHAAARVGSTAYAVSSLTAGEFFDVITYDGQAKTEAQLNAVAADLLAGNYT